MSGQVVRVGVVGLGWWASRAHIPAILNRDGAELAAVVDSNEHRRRLAADLYSVPVRSAIDDVIADGSVDAVVIATPPSSHFHLARRAIDAGLHVLIEKPMVLDPEEADILAAAAERADVHVVVGYAWHFNSQAKLARRWIAEGRIGRLQYVASTFASVVRDLYAGRPDALAEELGYPVVAPGPASYSDPTVAGGGQGQTQLTHSIALLLHMTGLWPEEIFAFMSNDGLDVDVVDTLTVRFTNGCLGVIGATGASVPGQPEFLDYRLYGDSGHIHFDVNAGVLSLHDNRAVRDPLGHRGRVSGGRTCQPSDRSDHWPRHRNLASGSLARTVVNTLAAAYRSADGHSAVRLSEVQPWNG